MESIGITNLGYEIYAEPNEVGGYRYWSDENGIACVVFDSSITSYSTIELIMEHIQGA